MIIILTNEVYNLKKNPFFQRIVPNRSLVKLVR